MALERDGRWMVFGWNSPVRACPVN